MQAAAKTVEFVRSTRCSTLVMSGATSSMRVHTRRLPPFDLAEHAVQSSRQFETVLGWPAGAAKSCAAIQGDDDPRSNANDRLSRASPGWVEGGDGIPRLRRPRRASPHGAEKSGFVGESCRGAQMSGGLSHCRPLIIVDNVPSESIRAAAHDIACRASKVNILAVGTCAIN